MKRGWEPWLLAGPSIVLYIVFTLSPLVVSVLTSVFDFGYYGEGFIGLRAFKEVFAHKRIFEAAWTTIKYTGVLLPLSMAAAIGISVVLSWTGEKLRTIGRALYFIPTSVSIFMVTIAWRYILSVNGALNHLLGTETLWLASNPLAFWTTTVVALSVSVGSLPIYIMGAFLSIDDEVLEAAKLDGCSRLQEAWHIKIPMIAPVLIFLTIQRLAGFLQIWQVPYSLTGGGPNYGTNTLVLHLIQTGFVQRDFPQGAVMSLFLLLIVLGVLIPYRLISGKRILD